MRAPVSKRSDDEIIADIMKVAGLRGFIIGEDPKHRRIRSIKPLVSKLIDNLRADPPPFTGNRKINREYARDLREQIDKLKKTLGRAPKPLSAVLFAPELFFQLAEQQGTALGINPQTRSYLSQTPTRLAVLLAQLDWLRVRCDQIIKIKLGTHGALDHKKLHAAIAGQEVLEFVAAVTGERPSLAVSLTSDYCRISSLFFEAATGRHVSDFRQACETVTPPPLRTKE